MKRLRGPVPMRGGIYEHREREHGGERDHYGGQAVYDEHDAEWCGPAAERIDADPIGPNERRRVAREIEQGDGCCELHHRRGQSERQARGPLCLGHEKHHHAREQRRDNR